MNNKREDKSMTATAKRALVPKLRFPEFREAGEWEEAKLGEFATFFKGKGLPKSVITPNGKNPCIHYGELFTEHPEVILAVKSYTDLDENIFLSVENDVLMPTSDVTPSGLAKACCIKLNDVILGGDILVIRTSKEEISGEFLARFIRYLEREVLQLVSGSTVFHLYASSIDKLALAFPRKKEQQKIADCLSSLDDLITAQTQKLDTLKTHKKGLMQQLFPAEGETLPKLRFPEFRDAGEWVEKKLETLSLKISDGIHSTPLYDDSGEYFFINGNNLIDGGIVVDEKTKRVSEEEYKKHKRHLGENTILLSINGTIGNLSSYNNEKVVLGKSACYINIDAGKALKDFISYYLKTSIIYSYFSTELTGSTIKNLSLKTVSNTKIYLPTRPEQQKIAGCLASLDELLTAQTQKLAALKTHKKGLMQQLFPALDEAAA